MTNWLRAGTLAAVAAGTLIVGTAPQAEAQRWHHGGWNNGGAVAAGAAAGFIGGAAIGSLAARPYYGGYYDDAYAYGPAAYPAYRRVYVEPRRRVIVRRPYYGPRVVVGAPYYGYGFGYPRYAWGPGYGYWGGPRYGW